MRINGMTMARRLAFVLAALGLIACAAGAEAGSRSRSDFEKLDGPYYMRIERIVVPKIADKAVPKLFTYMLVVEFADAEARERAKVIMPKLMDAYLHDLHVLTSRAATGDNGPDPAITKKYLLQSSQRILGAEAVKDVLIERTIMRKTG
jgi:hypothetical protein